MKLKFLLLGLVSLIVSLSLSAQTTEHTYYVTIGVYGVHPYAVKFTEKANKNNFSAQYAINPQRRLYYVYLFSSPDKVKAIAFMIKMRAETEYKDAWVFGGSLGDALVDPGKEIAVTNVPAETKPNQTKPNVIPAEVKPDEKKSDPVVVQPPKDTVAMVTPVVKPDTAMQKAVEKPVGKPVPVAKHDGIPFNFKLINSENGNEIMGEVHVQEGSKATQYQAFRGNEIVYLKPPVNATGTYTIITNAPGYRQIKETITFKTPEATKGVTKGAADEFIVPMDLKRARQGDYMDFNNVKFIRNSSIMTPESQNELDGLVTYMKENSNSHIKIHGHSNGKAAREIVINGASDNYFAMDPRNKKETASAMVLSEARAEAVKNYLVSKGIETKRVSTKGEGGKIPLYPANSTLNSYNDRVEIEVKKK